MSRTSPTTSSDDAIRDIHNDPDLYMEIRPTRNSNACASCRKKKKRCEPGIYGPNTTCKRCSDYGLECKYEYALGQQSAFSSPAGSAASSSRPPSPQHFRRDPSMQSDSSTPWSHRGGASTSATMSRNFLDNMSFASPSHSGNLQPSTTGAATSPFTNIYGVLHQGNVYPNLETNSLYPSQGFTAPFTTTDRAANHIGSSFTAPQFDPLRGENNSFDGLTHRHTSQYPMNFAEPTPPASCECTLETTCYLHRPRRSAPSDTSESGWTQSSYFR